MKAKVEPSRLADHQPPLRIHLEYWCDYMIGEMVIEECTIQPGERDGSEDLIFTTRMGGEFTFRRHGDEAVIETGAANDFPEIVFPREPSDVLEENLRHLCERE